MKKAIIIGLVLIMISIASAQVYNYASVQPGKVLNVIPGGEVTTKLLFYNYYGDAITHISLFPISIPEGWVLEIDPAVHNDTFDVSGELVTVSENLFVSPEEAYPEKRVEEGYEYLEVAGVDGYVRAKVVNIVIRVPEDAEVREVFDVKIGSRAAWLGLQSGTISVKQERGFSYQVKIVPEEEYIRFVEPTGFSVLGFVQENTVIILIFTLIILSITMFYMAFMLKKKGKIASKRRKKK